MSSSNASSVENSKRDSDVVVLAAQGLRLEPASLMMIGDTPYDISAARKVRMDTIAFTCGGWSTSELRGAVEIYSGPQDLLERFSSSAIHIRARL